MAYNDPNWYKFFFISAIICGIAASILFVVQDPSRYCTSFLDSSRWASLFLLLPLLLLFFLKEKGVYYPSSASPPPSLSLISSNDVPERKYYVFVSFRGTDTRSTILSHLLKALLEKKVETFVDYKLRKGDEMSPTLIRAILESEISVIVFSKDYAASKWCLEELAQIIECMENHNQIVIPIFYHIDPSSVRHQKGSYKVAFTKHEMRLKHDMPKLQKWRTALEKAANLSGFHSSDYKPNDMRRLRRKNVLDDINDSRQIKIFTGGHEWFGSGSVIIVTSRDKHIFSRECDEVYEVKPLNFEAALQLFNLNALAEGSVEKEQDCHKLSMKVVDYANGIPLAIKVLGSFLYDKNKDEWESQLKKLEKMPYPEIQDVLKLSYDELDDEQKDIFLYLACFFTEESKERVIFLLDACDYHTIIGLKVLQDKALITISEGECVSMHELIRNMGREVVCGKSRKDPTNRNHLWDLDDIDKVLKNNTGTRAIESISQT